MILNMVQCFIEPSTGNTFYSKPEVSRYLKGKEERTDSSGKKKIGVTVDSSVNVCLMGHAVIYCFIWILLKVNSDLDPLLYLYWFFYHFWLYNKDSIDHFAEWIGKCKKWVGWLQVGKMKYRIGIIKQNKNEKIT